MLPHLSNLLWVFLAFRYIGITTSRVLLRSDYPPKVCYAGIGGRISQYGSVHPYVISCRVCIDTYKVGTRVLWAIPLLEPGPKFFQALGRVQA